MSESWHPDLQNGKQRWHRACSLWLFDGHLFVEGNEMRLVVDRFGQWVRQLFVEADGVDLRDAKQVVALGDSVWAITQAGVVQFDGKSWRTLNADWTEHPHLLLPRQDGTVWVHSDGQIFAWDGKVWKTFSFPSDEPFPVTAWAEGEEGTVWLVAFQW